MPENHTEDFGHQIPFSEQVVFQLDGAPARVAMS